MPEVDLPVTGRVTGYAAPEGRLDDATLALRLRGEPGRQLLLAGDVEVAGARVPASAASKAKSAKAVKPKEPAPGAKKDAKSDLEAMRLDVRVRSRGGAITVDVPHAPDLHIDVDYRVRGTVGHPEASGQISGSGVYSRFLLWLARLFT
jgi:hypothetical protein